LRTASDESPTNPQPHKTNLQTLCECIKAIATAVMAIAQLVKLI
jgi:hypothetical protein